MLVRGIVRALIAFVLAGWWLKPTTLHAVPAPRAPEPVCASWSFGDASPTTDGVGIPLTVVVATCPDAGD